MARGLRPWHATCLSLTMKTRYSVSNVTMTVPADSLRDATKLAREWALQDPTGTIVVLDRGVSVKAFFMLGSALAERGKNWCRQIDIAVATGALS